jgi:hypothetical protein
VRGDAPFFRAGPNPRHQRNGVDCARRPSLGRS